jgi:hypothetical protein
MELKQGPFSMRLSCARTTKKKKKKGKKEVFGRISSVTFFLDGFRPTFFFLTDFVQTFTNIVQNYCDKLEYASELKPVPSSSPHLTGNYYLAS